MTRSALRREEHALRLILQPSRESDLEPEHVGRPYPHGARTRDLLMRLIEAHVEAYGSFPSMRALARASGRVPSSVLRNLRVLWAEGRVEHTPAGWRLPRQKAA